MQLRKNDRYAGFDSNTGETWIYPTNYPLRKYQFSITQAALFENNLVELPTELEKTFITAVVMQNIYRCYPTGEGHGRNHSFTECLRSESVFKGPADFLLLLLLL